MATLMQQPVPSKLQGGGGGKITRRDFPSLFAPDSDEEFSSDGEHAKREQTRPSLLPLEELIRDAPKNLTSLLEILLPRLQPRAEVKGVSMEDQQNLATILVGELSSQFVVLQQQIDDPFMSHHQNRVLHKQITLEVCRIIEDLYNQYVAKAARIDTGGVFSVQANLSRLRAELTLQANKSLNIPAIRRQLLSQHRSLHPLSTHPDRHCTRLPPLPKWRPEKKTPPKPATSLEQLRLDEPLKVKVQRFGVRLESRAVKRKIRRLRSKFPKGTGVLAQSTGLDQDLAVMADSESSDVEDEQPPPTATKQIDQSSEFGLRRVSSMPELGLDSLLCDFGLITRQKRLEVADSRSSILGIKRRLSVDSFMDLKLDEYDPSKEKPATRLGEYTLDELSKDLSRLKTSASDLSASRSGIDELSPLLQAHVHGLSSKQSRRLKEFEAELWRQLQRDQPRPPQLDVTSSSLEKSIPSVSTMEQLPSLPFIPYDSGSSHQSMLVKSGFSMRSGRGTSGKGSVSVTTRDIEDASSLGAPGSMMDDNDSVFGQHSDPDLLDEDRPPTATPRATTHLSLGQTTTYVSLGESRLTFDDLRQLGAGESGFAPGDYGDDEKEEEEHREATPTPGKLSRLEGLHQSQSTLKGSHYSLSSDLAFQDEDFLPDETHDLTTSKGQSSSEQPGEGVGHVIHQPQPAVIATRIDDKKVVRTTDVRVSERTPLTDLRLESFGPIYNELTGELTSGMIEDLDSLLHSGREITTVYEELTKTLPNDHLDYDNESSLDPTIQQRVDLSKILASNALHHRRSRRIVNPQLYRDIPHPWGGDRSKEEWQMSNQYQGPPLDQYGIKPQAHSGLPLSPRLAHIARKYNTWLLGWRSTLDTEDYLKFASREESDYLHLLYHLYDSDGSDSEAEEEEKQRRARAAALKAKLQAKEFRRQQRYLDKSRYQAGVWNVNTVRMGGLGGDPDLSSSSDEDVEDHLAPAKQDLSSPPEVQKRLQSIWSRLQCTESQQMDMAIKYSSNHVSSLQLNEALSLWEEGCDMIEKREDALSRLETFERAASDPTRFFAKGQQGSSVVRLEEARKRDQLHKELDGLDASVSQLVYKLQVEHGDTITFKGRPYSDKMRFDRTEMLYWLQQERRQLVLRPALNTLTSPATPCELSLPSIVTPVLKNSVN